MTAYAGDTALGGARYVERSGIKARCASQHRYNAVEFLLGTALRRQHHLIGGRQRFVDEQSLYDRRDRRDAVRERSQLILETFDAG